MWETAIRNCRTRVKGTARFGIEEPLCEVQSRKQTARKERMISDSEKFLSLVGLCRLLQRLILEHSLLVTLRWE